MHRYIYKYKKYLNSALTLILCTMFVLEGVSAFQISGGGDNLRVIQSNQSKSTSFQVNAKLKPTAVARNIVPIPQAPTTTPPVTIPTTPVETSGSDGSSPYLGTANWGYQDRSAEATARKKLAQAGDKDEINHAAPPKKDILDNLVTQIVKKEDQETPIENELIEVLPSYDPQNDRIVAINDHQVSINPLDFSLRFLETDIISKETSKEALACGTTYIYNSINNDYWYIIAKSLFLILIGLTLIFFCLAILTYLMWRKSLQDKKNPAKKSFFRKLKNLLPILLLIVAVASNNNASAGPVTTPQQLIYEGELLDNSGAPLTGDYSFRFSLWDNEDFEITDNISGSINIGAADYFGWQEVQADSLVDGKFSLRLGSISPFFAGLFDRTDMYLQIEVKNSTDPDTSYELIDLDINSDTIDRTVIDTIPFAFNSDKLDFRDTGFGAGEIPYLDINSKLDKSIIPNGVDDNDFTLDDNGDALATDIITLKFGDSLNKTLVWNGLANQFEFNDKVSITGDLIVTGTINGESIGPKNKTEILSPRYPNSIIDADGTYNSGSMYEEAAVISGNNKNTLRWDSKKTAIQDYDVIVRHTLPANFAGFQATPISLEFMSEGTFTDAKIDFTITKEGSASDELSGFGIGFNSNSWTTVNLNLNPATVWVPNDTMVIKMKMYSRNNLQSHVSDISLRYIEN